jgi:hypothetical protein
MMINPTAMVQAPRPLFGAFAAQVILQQAICCYSAHSFASMQLAYAFSSVTTGWSNAPKYTTT